MPAAVLLSLFLLNLDIFATLFLNILHYLDISVSICVYTTLHCWVIRREYALPRNVTGSFLKISLHLYLLLQCSINKCYIMQYYAIIEQKIWKCYKSCITVGLWLILEKVKYCIFLETSIVLKWNICDSEKQRI